MQSVDLACKSLRNGETSLSLACGVNLLLRPFTKDMMPFVIAENGECKTFSEGANGFGRAEGCGVLVLKRYTDAVKDGDHVWALIRGSSCVQEGTSRSMGRPTKEVEALAMRLALQDAGVQPKDVSFIEAHGTGTTLGDPLEISAITEVYGNTLRDEPLVIGSVKTNIGHTESCSGITGIVKVVASLINEQIPPHLNFTKLNPQINLDVIPARIPLEAIPWPRNKNKPRLAGISSFGITGTDGHLIIQDTPQLKFKDELSVKLDIENRPLHIMKLSARSEAALEATVAQYLQFLENQENESFANICYTANKGRASFTHRAVVIAKDKEEACKILQTKKYSRNEVPEGISNKICFLFTGQGAQFAGMAVHLYETSPVFRMNFDKCSNILLRKFGLNLKSAIWGPNAEFELSKSLYSQTGIFCVEYCLLKLWESWGIKPDYVMGHSLGEFCAAVAAEILSLEDALTMVAERSRLVESLPKAKMVVIKADKQTVDTVLLEFSKTCPGFWLDYAAVNSTDQTVLAGETENVESFSQFCSLKKNIKTHILDASHAFHSRLMDPILEQYGKVVGTIDRNINTTTSPCKFISGVHGKLMDKNDPAMLSLKYWIDHTREKVNFIGACNALTHEECKYFLEIGPQPILSSFVIANTSGIITCTPSMRRNEENWKTILGSLGKLYLHGWSVNWKDFDKYCPRRVIPSLPTYPFQRKRHWFDTQNKATGSSMFNNETLHPLLGCMFPNASGAKIFQNAIDLRKRVEWIKDHCVGKRIIFPGTGFLEMCLSAGHCTSEGLTDTFCRPSGPLTIENLKIMTPLALEEKEVCHMQVVLQNNSELDDNNDGTKIQVYRQHIMDGEAPKWTEHCVSYFTPATVDFDEVTFRDTFNFAHLKKNCQEEIGIANIYSKLAEVGLNFGEKFQSLAKIWKGDNGILVEAKVPTDKQDYIIHPVLMDAMLQSAMVVQSKGNIERLHVPIGIKKFTWLQYNDNAEDSSDENKYFIYSCYQNNSTGNEEEKSVSELISVLFFGNPETDTKIVAFMSGMEFAETSVNAIEAHLDSQKTDLPALHNEVWKPNLGPNQFRVNVWEVFKEDLWCETNIFAAMFKESNNFSDYDMLRETLLQTLCYSFVLKAYSELGWNPPLGETFHLDKLMSDLKISPQHKKLVRFHMTMLADKGNLTFVGEMELKVTKLIPSSPEIHQLIQNTKNKLETFENISNSLQIYCSCGSNLGPILQGKMSALPILFPQDPSLPSASTFYTESYNYSGMDNKTVDHFQKLLHPNDPTKKGVIRILEVGAGTGNFSRDILKVFSLHGIEMEYTFSDISPAFFINASKKFEEYKDCMKFQVFNVEEDAKTQGFSPHYFDIVLAADVIHATKSLADSISNIRQLLRPGGLLFLIEGVLQNHITCIFGLLEGYWRFVDTDIRKHHPLVTGDTWKDICFNNGFDKVFAIPCCMYFYSFVIARASIEDPRIDRPTTFSQGKWLVFPTLDNESKHLVNRLSAYRPVITVWRSINYQESDDGTGYGINVNHKHHMTKLMESIKQSGHIEGILYLWGLSAGTNTDQGDIAQPFLNLCQAVLEMKQQHVPKFFLVTNGIYQIGDHLCENPAGSTLLGIGKSCANEMNMKFKAVDVCPITHAQGGLDNANDIFYELWNDASDWLIAYREKTRYFGKLMKTKLTEKALKLPQNDRFHLILPQSKAISDLKFGTLGKYSLKPYEIEVHLKAAALNFRDVFAVLKPDAQFEKVNTIGSDFAGVVCAIGSQVTKWKIGDSVFGCNFEEGALPSHIRIVEDEVVQKPESWTFAEACGLPAVFATAYYCLFTIAKMKKGETALIHTGKNAFFSQSSQWKASSFIQIIFTL